MRLLAYALLLIGVSFPSFSWSQTGCPGCTVALPAGLPADTVYLPPIPDGQSGVAYSKEISFRMPKTTTPVAAIDSVTPPGLTINSIQIVSVEGLPPGLSWEANQTIFPVATQTDGCIRICGTPTVSDSFLITVKLKATVFVFTQDATFPMRMYIAPAVSTNDGFSMSSPVGCGQTLVGFENNIQSGGQPGFTYNWDFGDSTTYVGENPPPHLYDTAGTYIVRYQAIIDTTGFILSSVTLQTLPCSDNLGLNAPDVYVLIKDSTGTIIFQTPNYVNNIILPATIGLNVPIGNGNYVIEVWDEDGGLQGTDDLCGAVSFNRFSNGNIVSGNFTAVLNIIHPITTRNYTDTVVVFPLPVKPVITAPQGVSACANLAPLRLVSSYLDAIQWYKDGEIVLDSTNAVYWANTSGSYQVAFTSADGCTVLSAPIAVEITPLPNVPVFYNNQNVLTVLDTLMLPADNGLQWYLNGQAIPSIGYWHCMVVGGLYTLEVVDSLTGCKNSYSLNATFNPSINCTNAAHNLNAISTMQVFPNPVTDDLWIEFGQPIAVQHITLTDAAGRPVRTQTTTNPLSRYVMDCIGLPDGVYYLTIIGLNGAVTRPVVILNR